MDAALSSKLGLLPLIVGSNLAKQLADYIPNLRVKWPNDLLVETESGAKKISGLLLEAIHDTDSVSVIIGVGFNLKKREIPGAVSFEEVSTISVSAGEISKLILDSILVSCQNLGSLSIEAFREQYNKQVISLGKVVKFVESSGAEISGINQGINEDGSLAINTGENTLNLYSGDVHQVN
jgi:BirA family biotin operon repressor/biotin-[acetyl-CoA-carboxylase] ligase